MRVLRDLVELDYISTKEETPIEERTPEWFVDRYLSYMAYHSAGRQRRAITSDSDSDIDPDTGGRLIAGREHILRHVSRAEIASLYAEHAEWLVHQTYQMVTVSSARRSFDPDLWREQWLPEVRRDRQQAKANGRRWGVWVGEEEPVEYAMAIDDIPWPASASKKKKRKTTKKSRVSASLLW